MLRITLSANGSLYCCSDGVRGRGAAVKYLSHNASFHSKEKIAPSNRGIKQLVKKGEQIFIPENVPHSPYNLSKKECVWVVVHSSGDDQDELIAMPELEYILEEY